MALNPPIKGPITDLNRILPNSSEYQAVPRCHCALVETRYMECMDSYGLDLSRYKCNQYREDWLECINYTKQVFIAKTYFDLFNFLHKRLIFFVLVDAC